MQNREGCWSLSKVPQRFSALTDRDRELGVSLIGRTATDFGTLELRTPPFVELFI